jgi:hypothetical protein
MAAAEATELDAESAPTTIHEGRHGSVNEAAINFRARLLPVMIAWFDYACTTETWSIECIEPRCPRRLFDTIECKVFTFNCDSRSLSVHRSRLHR